jgi:hypothetical protein
VSARSLTASILCLAASIALGAQSAKSTAPESFRINGQVTDTPGGVAASMALQIDSYTPDDRHQTIVTALKAGDNAAFLDVLRRSPVVGSLKMGDRSVPIRWARSQPQPNGKRRVAVMTESPVFFFGAGAADAKPTAGYDVGVLEFTIDSVGMGKGTMAAAAKVKPGGPTGIQIDDYSGKRIELTTVTRNAK